MKTIWECPECKVELQIENEDSLPEFAKYRNDLDWLDIVKFDTDYGPDGDERPEYTVDFPNGEYTIDGKVYCPECVMECETCNTWIFTNPSMVKDVYAPGASLYDELHNRTVCITCYEELIFCFNCGTQYTEYMDLATPCNWEEVESPLQDLLVEKGITEDWVELPQVFIDHLEQEFTFWVHENDCCVSCIDAAKAEKEIFPKLDLTLLGEETLSESPMFEFCNPAQSWIAGVLKSVGWQLQLV